MKIFFVFREEKSYFHIPMWPLEFHILIYSDEISIESPLLQVVKRNAKQVKNSFDDKRITNDRVAKKAGGEGEGAETGSGTDPLQ